MDLRTLTKDVFDAAMERGWATLGYFEGSTTGKFYSEDGECTCAVGAAAVALGVEAYTLYHTLFNKKIGVSVTVASDDAGNKGAAIAAVKAIQW